MAKRISEQELKALLRGAEKAFKVAAKTRRVTIMQHYEAGQVVWRHLTEHPARQTLRRGARILAGVVAPKRKARMAMHTYMVYYRRQGRARVGVPTGAEKLLYLFLPKHEREYLPGDLEEEYRTDILPRFGPKYAYWWYWSQAIRSTLRVIPSRVKNVGAVVLLGKIVDWIKKLTG